jgi:predicted DNA-binding transcriptional regulator YafY
MADTTTDKLSDQRTVLNVMKLFSLLKENALTYAEIAEQLHVSERSAVRYVESFRSAGFVFRSDNKIKKKAHYRFVLSDSHLSDFIPLLHFTEEEADLLNEAFVNNTSASMPTLQIPSKLRRKILYILDDYLLPSVKETDDYRQNIEMANQAVDKHLQVILRQYKSSSSGTVLDRMVEPFFYQGRDVFYCYDLAGGKNKIFRVSRAKTVELKDTPWQYADRHRMLDIDLFGMVSDQEMKVTLQLAQRAYNLLLEEYPKLKDSTIQSTGDVKWAWQVTLSVRSYVGIGRFVMGLAGDIRIVDSPDFKDYLRTYWDNSKANII